MAFDESILDALVKTARSAAQPRTWSKGVLFARDGAVEGVEETEDEIVLQVHTSDRPVSPTVVLYPETEEWDCDCGSRLDVCSHVVAALIAVTQLRKSSSGGALPASSKTRIAVRYRFNRAANLLELERLEVPPEGMGDVRRIVEPIKQSVGRPRNGFELVLDDADIALDRLLPKGRTLIDRREQAQLLFQHLSVARGDIYLEEELIAVDTKLVLPQARVYKRADTHVFTIEADPEITGLVAPDIVRIGGTLRLLGEVGLVGSRLERLPIEKVYPASALAVLMHEVLPSFSGRFPIDMATTLPKARGKGRPRIDMAMALGDRSVSVTPTVVYGDPPTVRIEANRPVFLGGLAPERDFEAEHKLVDMLRSELNLVPDRTTTVAGAEGGAFLQKIRKFEAGLSVVRQAELPQLQPQLVMEEDGRFSLSFSLDDKDIDDETWEGGRSAEAGAALEAFRSGHGLVPLLGGGWARLSNEWWGRHADEVALLLRLRDKDGRLPNVGLPTLGRLAEALDHPPPPALKRLSPLFEGFVGLPEAILPEDLQATLRIYQREGVNWLVFLRDAGLGALLADDMGLGKTLQMICVFQGRCLVVCPTSVLSNWAAEIAKFRPSLRVHTHHGAQRTMDKNADVVLTTYALLRLDREELTEEQWAIVVLDEAQAIKNPSSLTARSAYSLRADFRVSLSGTPVENRLLELWSQMHFANPGLLGGQSEFESQFSKPIEAGDLRANEQLRSRIRPLVLRRLKKDVAKDLPPRTDVVLHIELDEGERAAYDGVRLATQKEVAERLQAGGGVLAALEALLRLRQAACHTGLLPGRGAEGSSKLDLLSDKLEQAVSEGHKALVFSQWTQLLNFVEPYLRKTGLAYVRLDGKTSDRQSVVNTFQDPHGPPIMLISLKAGGTGLNLTAADHVFLLDPWWNPAAEDQAADRAHRIGQDRPVFVHRLVARDTVEEKILALQAHKRKLSEAAIGDAAAAVRVTKDDLLALLT
ncbi:MAG: DEAD/DEAH box helicase [Myxococcales bacterium]|nr:DEAD/DEAH box helicase [Myxococcales bacterium]